MDPVEVKFATLKGLLDGGGAFDIKQAESLMDDLKLELIRCRSQTSAELSVPIEQRLRLRDILEYDALLSIRTRNLEEFERAMSQLKGYYFVRSSLPPSPHMALLLAVHLVSILASEKLSEKQKVVDFNLELELTRLVVGRDVCVDYAVELHQAVIDNSFSRLFQLENAPPSPLFSHFTSGLLEGARNSHARSIQRAYRTLTLDELTRILHFATKDETREFVMKKPWTLHPDESVEFGATTNANVKSARDMLERAVDLSARISSLA